MLRSSQSDRLIEFFDLSKNGVDPRERQLQNILNWSDQDLEYSHDYIQNVFPLPESSAFNSAIWIVDEQAYTAFRERPELRDSLHQAFARMCSFYGLKLEHNKISRADNFDDAKFVWLTRFNHNHLRITRILRSLRVLGLSASATAFHDYLESDSEVLAKVGQRSRMYWSRAAKRPLHLPPDEDDETAHGVDWLHGKS